MVVSIAGRRMYMWQALHSFRAEAHQAWDDATVAA
jgi:hypothetical protein